MFNLTLIKTDQRIYDIMPIVGTIEWQSNFSLLTSLDFDVAYSDARYPVPSNPIDVGDHIVLTKDKEEIFRGVIVDEDRSGRKPISYSAYDYTWYLAQSTTVYQFNKVPAHKAVKQILDDFGIMIGSIITMPTLIDAIYIEQQPAKILNEIISKVEKAEGYRVHGEMRQGKLYLVKRSDLLIKGSFRIADNLKASDVLESISEPSRTRSIADMRNRIRLIIDDDDKDEKQDKKDKKKKSKKASYIVTATAQDDNLIKRYGLLEETIKMDIEDSAKARQAAKILLERLGRVHETNSSKFMGDTQFKGGRLFDVKEPITGMNNRFMISSAHHKLSNQIHTMELELVLPSEVD